MKDSDIEELLFEIYNSDTYFINDSFQTTEEQIKYRSGIIYLKDELKLIRRYQSKFELTPLGYEIINKGGWIKHLDNEHKRTLKSEQKENFEFKIAKWKYHTFWWFFAIAIFGGGYSMYDFIKNLTKQEYDQSKLMTKKQMESEISKLHTLILNQKKGTVLVQTSYPLKK